MSRYSLPMLALALLVFVQPGLAQRNDQIFLEGLEALYNLDFDVAETHFRRLAELDPQRPEPGNQLAATLWLKIVAGQEKLNLESFSGASLGADDSSDAVGAQEEKQLRTPSLTPFLKPMPFWHATAKTFRRYTQRVSLKPNWRPSKP